MFIKKQLRQITDGGFSILFFKLKLLNNIIVYFLVLLSVSVFISIPFLLIVLVVKPFILIRWKELSVRRLGDFAGDAELYLCERDVKLNVPQSKYTDLFYTLNEPCNLQLYQMWKKHLNIIPKRLGILFHGSTKIIILCKKLFPSLQLHIVPPNTHGHRDILNLLDKVPQHLKFTHKQKQQGDTWLKKHNIPNTANIVLLCVRDNAYLAREYESIWKGSKNNWDYHNYRDCDINNFVRVAEKLANMGFYVIRIGFHVNEKLKTDNPLVIDYATNGMRDDFMDIYLSSICKFIISTGHGAEAPAAWCFRKPRVIVNQCPTGLLQTFSSKDLLLTKHHFLQNENRELTLSEIFTEGVGFCLNTQCYNDKRIKLKENTPNEICDITMEMVSRLDGSWKPESEDDFLQNKFWEIFPVDAQDTDGTPYHGKIKAHYGANYLRNNPEWLQ